MKKFAYYPGCSLEKMAQSYHLSTVETARVLGVELKEIDDWNCCGATAYFHVDELLAHTLCARNLAMAEAEGMDLVAPCSGCYKNMHACNKHLQHDHELADHINFALEEDNLHFKGNIKVHHLIQVFAADLAAVKAKATNPLTGLKVAPYYGCQILRPRKYEGENVEEATYFEDLMTACGATAVDFRMKLRCCGAALIITNRQAALSMVRNLLQNALDSGAEVIATACPLCQVNLECYQDQVNSEFGTKYNVPIFYFTQLMGLAMGIAPKQLGVGTEFVAPPPAMLAACGKARAAAR
jgi:heterodisulfide reductase subunit B